ncbi:hypothetical protein DL98DRAFT_232064 [Cadophora sp. DSE1049]|nr:hypothetical protein DL98DRAFT_232064 [Cadophora sp. DSE1049]
MIAGGLTGGVRAAFAYEGVPRRISSLSSRISACNASFWVFRCSWPALNSACSFVRVSMTWLCWVMVSFKFATSHAISSRTVPLPSPPPENSKLGVSLAPANVIVSFFRLLYPLVILLNSDGGGEVCCGVNDAVHRKLLGGPSGSPLVGSTMDLVVLRRVRNRLHTTLESFSPFIQ